MVDLGASGEIVRMWALADAPPQFLQVLALDPASPHWVAHVPAALVDEPLVALLIANDSPSHPVAKILLDDGSRLLVGSLLTQDLAVESPRDSATPAMVAYNQAPKTIEERRM